MATIIIRNSTGSGAVPSLLVQGELAINTVDGKLFYGSGSGNVVKEFTGSGGGGGSTNTGSLLTTASFSNPNITFTKGDGSTFNVNLTTLVPTSASYALTASVATTASLATNAITASIATLAGTADTAKTVVTIANTTNAEFYPTFVDSNNTPTAASEIVYTSNKITFNPSTQVFASANIFATSITASKFTGSLTGSLLGTASFAIQALSASWAPSVASNPFPFTGSAIISGSLAITGSIQVGVPGVNNPSLDTTIGTLSRGTQAKVDWINGYLNNSSGVTSVDWESAFLNDGNAITRVDWGNGSLNDSAGTTALDWESRRMIDAAGARSADFDVRSLIYPDSTTALNYGTQGQILITGGVSSSGGFTGSLQGTASYATQALSASWAPGGATTAGAQIFGNLGGSGFTNPIVTYLPFGFTTVSANELQRQLHVGVGGTVKNFYLRTNNTAAAGSYTTFTIRINGASSGIQIAVSGGQVANVYSNITNTATINPGDYVSIQVSTSIANGPQLNSYGFAIE